MFSPLKKLFGRSSNQKNFQFLVIDEGEDVGNYRWYRMRHWNSQNFLIMDTDWDKDWKSFSAEEEVVGITFEDRQRNFLIMGDSPEFRVHLQREPNNPKDKNAIKVIGTARVNGRSVAQQLGYLSKQTAKQLKDEKELDARPYSVYLPYEGRTLGLRIRVLVRTQAYKKKTGQVPTTKKRATSKKTPKKPERNIRREVFDDTYEYFDDARQDYDCKKVSKKLFKQVFDAYFDTALRKRGFTEEQLNASDNDFDLDLADDLIDATDDIVEQLFRINPGLRKRD